MGYPAVKQKENLIEKDPVCGMTVSQPSRYRFSHEGIEYHFCSEVCRTRFSDDPLSYLHGDDNDPDHQCHD
ncbi:MAG: YHS domain-containing protein, partial [Candidatus Thiodiazotropha endolucinida]